MLYSKHIAAYLPYSIYAAQARSGVRELYLIYGLKHSTRVGEWIAYLDDSRHGDYQQIYLKGVSLALRPLDDLLKDSFQHQGKEIKPKEILTHLDLESLVNSVNPYELVQTLNQKDFETLLSWHIDVFGLIPKERGVNLYNI